MDMVLRRLNFRDDGILGELVSDDIVSFSCATLEHAYTDEQNGWVPKLKSGLYRCVYGTHQLAHHPHPFKTFEITNVPGHTNILFHIGNFNNDSEGCVLLGQRMPDGGGSLMISDSKVTFERFMNVQRGVSEFNLTVIDYPSMVGRA